MSDTRRAEFFKGFLGNKFSEATASNILKGLDDEESYKTLLNDLYQRGLISVELIIHDGARGITAACSWVYPYAQHQRCIFHKQMNLIQNIRHRQNKSLRLKESKEIFKAGTKKKH